MRGGLLAVFTLLLAACDSGGVPPPGQEPLRPGTPQVAADEVELRGQGLVAGAEAFYFAAGRNEVEAALAPILGEPIERSANAQCGTGAMDFTEYPGGLIVNFQRGSLVGWNARNARADAQSEALDAIRVVGDVQVGTPRSVAEQARGFAAIEASTLGDEFTLGNAMGGFFEDDAVVMLYAGAQCFFR